jgi:hypothetical protein
MDATTPRGAFPVGGDGVVRALLGALRLRRGDRRDLLREALLFGALTWIPLAAIGVVEESVRGSMEPLLRDLAVHARLLVAIPLAIVADELLRWHCALVGNRLADEGFAHEAELAPIGRRAAVWSRNPVIEVALLVLAIAAGQAMFHGLLSATGLFTGERVGAAQRGPAAAWYAWVAFPIFSFLTARVLWHWVVWALTLWRLSRLPLRTEPAHPDGAAGLALLARPTVAIALVVFANSVVFSSACATAILRRHAPLTAFAPTFVTLAVVALLVSLGPLLPFFGRLAHARLAGRVDYSRLATNYVRRFHRRWIDPEPPPDPLGTPDLQSLADLANSFRVVDRMRLLPFAREEVLLVLLATLVPLAPLLLTQVPLPALLRTLAKALIGGA